MAGKTGRTFEGEMRTIVLRIAADSANGAISTTEAKEKAHLYFSPSDGDLKPNPKRNGEPMYYQIVGNVIGSHEKSRTSLYYKGYAERTEDGIRITAHGRDYLTSKLL